MPEGHTLHRHASQHRGWLVGQVVRSSSPQGRFTASEVFDGRHLLDVQAWGKHLVYTFDTEHAPHVHVHLGLYGRFTPRQPPVPPPRGAVRWRLLGPGHGFDLTGPTTCARIERVGLRDLVARLGPDPLREDADPERFIDGLARRRKTIAAALMDQSLLAGVGNVYRAEILYLRRLHPHRPARDLSREEAWALWQTAADALAVGERLGWIVTTDLVRPRSVPRGQRLWVYRRHTCGGCGGPVRREPMEGRTLWWCPGCQPPSISLNPAARTSRTLP